MDIKLSEEIATRIRFCYESIMQLMLEYLFILAIGPWQESIISSVITYRTALRWVKHTVLLLWKRTFVLSHALLNLAAVSKSMACRIPGWTLTEVEPVVNQGWTRVNAPCRLPGSSYEPRLKLNKDWTKTEPSVNQEWFKSESRVNKAERSLPSCGVLVWTLIEGKQNWTKSELSVNQEWFKG